VKAEANKNKVTVSWKKLKRLKKIRSIQVMYSTDPAFEQNVGVMQVKKDKVDVTLKLEHKMEYYVKVRYVGSDGVSRWSKVRKVCTK
jgi:hypothetical protein